MEKETVHGRIASCGVVPVVVAQSADQGVKIAEALLAGGVDVIEVTFRSEAAESAIRAISTAGIDTLLGAGTVRSVDQAKAAVAAGASFVVTPGFSRPVVEYCMNSGVPVYPGVNATMAIEAALEYDLRVLKFFPAGASGGIAMLKALKGPYFDVSFVPTGGIGADNLAEYLALSNVTACGGSWLTPKNAVASGDWAAITEKAREARAVVTGSAEA